LLHGRGERARAAQAVCHVAGSRVQSGGGGWQVTAALPARWWVTRPRHRWKARELAGAGRGCAGTGGWMLLLAADGSKRLIPAEWTQPAR